MRDTSGLTQAQRDAGYVSFTIVRHRFDKQLVNTLAIEDARKEAGHELAP